MKIIPKNSKKIFTLIISCFFLVFLNLIPFNQIQAETLNKSELKEIKTLLEEANKEITKTELEKSKSAYNKYFKVVKITENKTLKSIEDLNFIADEFVKAVQNLNHRAFYTLSEKYAKFLMYHVEILVDFTKPDSHKFYLAHTAYLQILFTTARYQEAEELALRLKKIFLEVNDKEYLFIINQSLGGIYLGLDKKKEAIKILEENLDSYDDEFAKMLAAQNLAFALYTENEVERAEKIAHKSWGICWKKYQELEAKYNKTKEMDFGGAWEDLEDWDLYWVANCAVASSALASIYSAWDYFTDNKWESKNHKTPREAAKTYAWWTIELNSRLGNDKYNLVQARAYVILSLAARRNKEFIGIFGSINASRHALFALDKMGQKNILNATSARQTKDFYNVLLGNFYEANLHGLTGALITMADEVSEEDRNRITEEGKYDEILIRENGLEIVDVNQIKDFPASKAGLKSGDRITHINKKSVIGMNSYTTLQGVIPGPPGSKITLTMQRENKEPFDVTLIRKQFLGEIVGIYIRGMKSVTDNSIYSASKRKSNNKEFGKILKKKQLLEKEIEQKEKNMTQQFARLSKKKVEENNKILIKKRKELSILSEKLKNEFTDTENKGLTAFSTVSEMQKILGKDEAAISILPGTASESDEIHILVITKNKEKFLQSSYDGAIAGDINKIVQSVDLASALNTGKLSQFPINISHNIYKAFLQPAEDLIKNKKHLYITSFWPAERIPFWVLLTSDKNFNKFSSNMSNEEEFKLYKTLDWLPKKYSITNITSLNSLYNLKQKDYKKNKSVNFVGIANPLLNKNEKGNLKTISNARLFRGSLADVNLIKTLPSLPETEDEVNMISKNKMIKKKYIYTKKDANENTIKNLDFNNIQVIAFATHGVVAGDFKNVVEPGLILTPPEKATSKNDGLLTASEITTLDLDDVEIVILSACNTATADSINGLNGLSSAFFFAGARSVLATYWSVESMSAANITIGLFNHLEKNPQIGRSEALRRSILDIINSGGFYSHPAIWAPFIFIGEGSKGI